MSYWINRQNQRVSGVDIKPFDNKDLYKVAHQLRNNMIDLIQLSTPTGKVYHINGKDHIASAPNEPPSTLSGDLINSIGQPTQISDNEYQIAITSEYALYLNNGTINMKPRPFVDTSIDKTVDELKSGEIL